MFENIILLLQELWRGEPGCQFNLTSCIVKDYFTHADVWPLNQLLNIWMERKALHDCRDNASAIKQHAASVVKGVTTQ